jgi:cytochrome P450
VLATLAPWRVPLVGELWSFLHDRLAFFEACARSGPAVRVRLGPRRALVLSDPDLVREVFVHEAKYFVRGITAAPLRSLLGEGLLLSEGDVWRRQRRDLSPLFGRDRAATWIPSIESAAAALLSRWRDGDRRDVHYEMHRLTLDVAARLFLGISAGDDGRLHPALEAILDREVLRGTIRLGPLRWPVRSSAATRALDDLVDRQIADAGSSVGSPFIEAIGGTARDRRELRDQLVTLIFTAQDTTAVALSWLWHLVSRNERVESELRTEIEGPVLPGNQLHPYLSAVLNETLRLFPPVIAQGRESIGDCTIGGVPVRRGDLVMFSQWVIHRDPRWFDQPEVFLPERWRDGLQERLHPFAYFPFGGGRRICVGRELALAVAGTVVPIIARRFRLLPIPGHEPRIWAVITPRPRNGLPMELVRLQPS